MKNLHLNKFTICFILIIFGFAGVSQVVVGQGNGTDYYIVDGKKIHLKVSKRYSAMKMRQGTSASEMSAFKGVIDLGDFGKVEKSPTLEQYGIVLVHINEGVGPSSFRAGTNSIRSMDGVESETPVYAVGGIDQVLVNEFIVQFKSDASEESINQSINNRNAEIVRKHDKVKNRYILRFISKKPRDALGASNEYFSDSLVEFSEPNFIRLYPQRPQIKREGMHSDDSIAPSSEAVPNDPLYPSQWALNNTGLTGVADADIDALEAWDIEKGSESIIIAIIDEGVDTNHKDLKDKIVTPYDATDGDNNQEPNPWDGHGTACAGIAAAVTNNGSGVAGVGWNVQILPVRIAYSESDAPRAPWITNNNIIEDGIRTAVDRGAHILSNSWGGGSSSNAINSAIDYAIAQNCIVVFAAGNSSSPVDYPGNLSLNKTIITVSASNEWDEFKTRTSSDNETWWGSCFGPEINVAAPGVHIYTTDISGSDGYTNGDYIEGFNGTSSSTPFVAGSAALVLSQNPTWGPSQVRDRIQSTADDLGAPGFDNQFGFGRLNAKNALRAHSPELRFSASTYGSLSSNGDEQVFSVKFPAKALVMLDGPDGADFDLYIKRAFPPTTTDYELRAWTNSADETLQVNSIIADLYYVMVRSYSGSGQFSLNIELN